MMVCEVFVLSFDICIFEEGVLEKVVDLVVMGVFFFMVLLDFNIVIVDIDDVF